MKFQFMKNHNKEFCVEKMAKVFQVSRAGYYKFLRRTPSKRELVNRRLIKEIKKINETSRKTYGSPRESTANLRRWGKVIPRKE